MSGRAFIPLSETCLWERGKDVTANRKKVRKSVWRMPRLTEAMKDVISCDKPRVGANNR